MKSILPVPEKRRARRVPSRKVRLAALCGLVCIALVTALLLLRNAPDAVPSDMPSSAPDTRVTLAEYTQDDIVRIELAPEEGIPYALVRGENGAFLMEGDASFALDAWLVEDMLSACDTIRLEPVAAIGDAGIAPREEDFGLSANSLRVTVRYADGASLALRFGTRLAYMEPERVYVLCGHDIYLAYSAALLDPLNRPRASMRAVPQIDIPSEALCGLEFTQASGVFALKKTRAGWALTSPVPYPADTQAVSAVLDAVLALRVMPPPDGAPALLPEATLTLTGAEGVRYLNASGQFAQTDAPARAVLVMGQTLQSGDRLAQLDGVPVTLASSSLAFPDVLNARSLAVRKPFTAEAASVTRLEIASPTTCDVYEIEKAERVLPNNAFETDEQGNVVYDTIITKNGAPCEADVFAAAYAEVTALSATGSLPDGWRPEAGDIPLKTISVSTAQGAHTLELYAFDALHAAMWLDGAGLFITPKPSE